jgi:hypothetical protein
MVRRVEDTKGAIRICISKKDRQHNSTNTNKTNNHLSSEMNSLKTQRPRQGLMSMSMSVILQLYIIQSSDYKSTSIFYFYLKNELSQVSTFI